MDPISAIVAALVAGAVEAARPMAVDAVKDAYAGLKALLVRKFSGTSTPIQGVEEKPSSEPRQSALKEELSDAGADRDKEVQASLQRLIDTLRQHAPQSVAHISATVSGGVNVQGSTFQGPATIMGGPTIQSDGGPVFQGAVNTGGGSLVCRDQIVNNITLQSVDLVTDLPSVLKSALTRISQGAEPEMLDSIAVVLDEISKLYQVIDTELTRYLSLTFDSPEQVKFDRAILVSLDGGLIDARAHEARGHCEKIGRLYFDRMRPWMKSKLTPEELDKCDKAFRILASSDWDMSCLIRELAHWLSQKASMTLDLLDGGDLLGANRLVKDARLDCHGLRQKLASTILDMRDIQADLIRLAP